MGDDAIWVRGLKAYGRHGVEEVERERPQALEVDLELVLDLSEASRSDKLADTVDYETLVHDVVEIVSFTSYRLLEGLAQRIADAVLERPLVEVVTVSVAKLDLPVGPDLDRIWVRITRRR
jgi:dihydroneopterin aldolase